MSTSPISAVRWSEIIERALDSDDEGHEFLQLENSTIRFVRATDSRGDGLGGIDVTAFGRDQALAAARERGLVADQGVIMIGGLRFYLTE